MWVCCFNNLRCPAIIDGTYTQTSDSTLNMPLRFSLRFSLRDVLLLTVIAGLVVGWCIDRSAVDRRYRQSVATVERLLKHLDRADPGWREREDDPARQVFERFRRQEDFAPTSAGVLGAALFAIAILIIVLIWQRRLHVSLLERHRR